MEDFHVVAKVRQAAKSHVDWVNVHADTFGVDSERPDPTTL